MLRGDWVGDGLWGFDLAPEGCIGRRQAGRSVADAVIHAYVEEQGHGYPSSEQQIPAI